MSVYDASGIIIVDSRFTDISRGIIYDRNFYIIHASAIDVNVIKLSSLPLKQKQNKLKKIFINLAYCLDGLEFSFAFKH
jgi:hypothetical protein